ncbi:ribokinase [Alistipes sp.]|uniref:ribokinase n=1 Tax=Alistipes sp. TaxID=1872444 RepID=UPI003AF09F2F
MNKILVIGSSNIDLIARVRQLPRPGETVGEALFMQANGGKGANQAVAAARLGGDVGFVSSLGSDAAAAVLREQFAADGIDTSTLMTVDDIPTGTALIFVSEDGENSIAVAPGANRRLTRERIDAVADRIAGADYLLLQLEIPLDTVAYAVELAHRAGTKVVLNPAPAMPLPDELLRQVHLITPNRTEAETLTGRAVHTVDDAAEAAGILLGKGVGQVIVTLGADGALIRTPEQTEHVPAPHVTPVDTTAAGDVFNGALLVALSERKSLSDAVRFAARCASVSVTRMGAQTSIPWRCEIGDDR